MKFKRNAIYIEVLALSAIAIFVSLFFMVELYNAGADVILFCLGSVLWIFLMLEIFIRGLFYDTVYYDERGIKIVTRKKTSEYAWDEILRIERIIGGKSGTLGWILVTLTGEKYKLYPFSSQFIEFVKKNFPYLEIKMM